jgi:hypothetical protein
MNRIQKSILVLTALSGSIAAQNTDDALRYSQTHTGGTALSAGMGGALGAVGADFSVVNVNPAGLGLYRQSEFGGSLSLFSASGTGTFYGSSDDDRKVNFNIPDLHLVIQSPNPNRLKTNGWLSTTFAVGYTKQQNFAERWAFRGVNPKNSLVNQFILSAGNASPDNLDPFGAGLAYQTYLIDPNTDSSGYTSIQGPLNGGMTQRGYMDARGRSGETNIAFAGNYSNRVYVGGSLAIRRAIYEKTFTYTERNDTDSIPSFESLQYTQTQSDRATSIAFRGGAIFRVNDFLRLGASAFLPLDYTVNTSYSSSLETSLASGSHSYESPDGEYRYRLRNPARFTFSGAFIFEKYGMLSVDYEMVDYSKLRLNDDAGSFDAYNDRMRDEFKATGNLRVGLEARFDELYLRGGLQMIGSPYQNTAFGKNTMIYSLGAGYRIREFYFDVAYAFSNSTSDYFPYSAPGLDYYPASIAQFKGNFVASMGTRF